MLSFFIGFLLLFDLKMLTSSLLHPLVLIFLPQLPFMFDAQPSIVPCLCYMIFVLKTLIPSFPAICRPLSLSLSHTHTHPSIRVAAAAAAMSNLSMVEATLPPGFRFHPRDDELICDYLSNKPHHQNSPDLLIQVDLNTCEPWDLPETACVGGKEWYFYSQRDRKYATGLRTNRATVSGYWKATGKDRCILRNRTLVGMRKTLVFYLGRAPKGKKTDWVMHEFRIQGPLAPPLDTSVKEDWVLCRVFCKNRELIGGKERNGYEDTASCSASSLPALKDHTFDMSSNSNSNNMFNYEQVPCFSNSNNMISNLQFDPIPAPTSAQCFDDEKKDVIKTILSRFKMMDNEYANNNSFELSFGEGISSDQSFLSDAALPVTMWYP